MPLKTVAGCPHKGWEWFGARDLREDDDLRYSDYDDCEFCGHEQIRYVHFLRHSDWPSNIAVGRICAVSLSGSSKIDLTERRLRNRASRRLKFPFLKSWKLSTKGNEWIKYLGHHIILIPWFNGAYRLRIDGKLGQIDFATPNDAKIRAFDVAMRALHNATKPLQDSCALS